jgi:hypothetical protein
LLRITLARITIDSVNASDNATAIRDFAISNIDFGNFGNTAIRGVLPQGKLLLKLLSELL